MAQSNHARAPQGASGTSRNRRRQQGGRPAWLRPFCRANYALDASVRLLGSTVRRVARSERCAHSRPVRASRTLRDAAALLRDASARLLRAAQELAVLRECVDREPAESTILLLDHVSERWRGLLVCLQETAEEVFTLREDVRLGLQTGTLVPERPAERRPRITLAPRPVSIRAFRAFLLLRQPRVVDRIAPILRRRRRTPRPAALRVPQPSLLGRAPPLV